MSWFGTFFDDRQEPEKSPNKSPKHRTGLGGRGPRKSRSTTLPTPGGLENRLPQEPSGGSTTLPTPGGLKDRPATTPTDEIPIQEPSGGSMMLPNPGGTTNSLAKGLISNLPR